MKTHECVWREWFAAALIFSILLFAFRDPIWNDFHRPEDPKPQAEIQEEKLAKLPKPEMEPETKTEETASLQE